MRSSALTKPTTLAIRTMQWSSAVIVMGITSYFINNFPTRNEHIIYYEVISTISVAFFLPAFISPFKPNALSRFVLPIDITFSYLWLTAVVFAAEDFNWKSCAATPPYTANCSIKAANEAFIFLTFFFTFFAIFSETANLWTVRRETQFATHEKPGTGRAPLDAPADVPASAV